MLEILTRDTCNKCEGTGEMRSREEATTLSYEHNSRARNCNMGGNFLSPEYFMKCNKCNGTGKVETWLSIQTVDKLLEMNRETNR
jgi:DnaJ-class molecular chaperone